MVQIPTFTAPPPEAPYLNPPPRYTHIGDQSMGTDKLATDALNYTQKVTQEQATKQGEQDQAAAGTTPIAEQSGLFGLPTISSEAYNKAARIAYGENKKTQLETDVSNLAQQYQYDPDKLKTKLAEYKTTAMKDVPPAVAPAVDNYFARLANPAVLRSQQFKINQDFRQNQADALDRVDVVKAQFGAALQRDPTGQGAEVSGISQGLADLVHNLTMPTSDKNGVAGPPLLDPIEAVKLKEHVLHDVSQSYLSAQYANLPDIGSKQAFIDKLRGGEIKYPALSGLTNGSESIPSAIAIPSADHYGQKLKSDITELKADTKDDVIGRYMSAPTIAAKQQVIAAVQSGKLGAVDVPNGNIFQRSLVGTLQAQLKSDIAVARSEIAPLLDDDLAARGRGEDGIIPQAKIRELYPPVIADKIISKQQSATLFFNVGREVSHTSLDDDAGLLAKFDQPAGPGFKYDQHMKDMLANVIAQKHTMLVGNGDPGKADPAAWILGQPEYKDLSAKYADPKQREAFLGQMDQLQTQLGLRSDQKVLLPKSEVLSLASQLNSGTPEDRAQRITGIADSTGKYWAPVLKQLVHGGHLTGGYQILASFTSNAATAEDSFVSKQLSDALAVPEKQYKEAIGDDISKVDKSVSSSLSDFNRTATITGSNAGLVTAMHDAATRLAVYYKMQGDDIDTAASKAVKNLTTRYDFTDTARVPKGLGSQINDATSAVIDNIKPENMPVPAPRPNETLTDQQRQTELAKNAKRGLWVTNEGDNGLVLVYPNSKTPVTLNDGQRVELFFRNLEPGKSMHDQLWYQNVVNGVL